MARRDTVLILATAIVSTVLALSTSALAVQPAAVAPGDTPVTGSLTVTPATVTVGQQVTLAADFPTGSYTVTFYEKAGDGAWTAIGTAQSGSDGNASLTGYAVDEAQQVYARITTGGTGITETDTLNPTTAPTGSVRGTLEERPSTYYDGDEIELVANFSDGSFVVKLYEETGPNQWTEVGSDASNSRGNAYFPGYKVDGSARVFAAKLNGQRTEVDTISPKVQATLHIHRDCTGNDCAMTATAFGTLNPAQAGRSVRLQYKSGDSWKSIGSAATTGSDGKVAIPLSLSGLSQWSVRTYRLSVASSGTSSSVTSNQIRFMPGPTQLGKHVLRVDVKGGIFPTTKGPEYEGAATLAVNGSVVLDEVPLESFGVRGHSSSKYVKKPYKLKFLDKPAKGTTVFGMPRGKNWTLLASWADRSLVREKTALDLGRRMSHIAWTPQSRYVEMFVNDQYRGSYLMTESVKIDGDRVDVDETHGMIMETDGSTVVDSSLGFMSTLGKIVFAFKDPDERKTLDDGDPDPDGVTSAKLKAIKDRINLFESKLYSSSTRSEYPDYIDVGSAIDYMLVREFAKDHDGAFYRSHYFSWDPSDPSGTSGNSLRDGTFHFGPAWDFDISAGNSRGTDAYSAYLRNPEGWIMRGTGTSSGDATYRTHWFVQLFKDSGWEAAVKARWPEVKAEFAKVYQTETAALKAEIGVGAQNDRNRWASETPSHPTLGTWDKDVAYATDWYKKRFEWMDDQLSG